MYIPKTNEQFSFSKAGFIYILLPKPLEPPKNTMMSSSPRTWSKFHWRMKKILHNKLGNLEFQWEMHL